MVKLIVDGINRNNHHLLYSIAGIAGYSGSEQYLGECSCYFELLDDDLLDLQYSRKVKEMIGEFVMEGFEVSYEEE